MELQATEYLLKPIREAKLLEVMEKVTARVDARREQLRKELEIKEKFEIIVPMMETGFINALCMFEDSEEELQQLPLPSRHHRQGRLCDDHCF